jgi:WD40 repeat protein
VGRIFDASSGRLVFVTPTLQGGLWAAIEDPEGPWLFTADADKSVKRWDLRSGKPATPPIRVSGNIQLLQGSNSGHCVAVGCDDDTVQLFDVRSGNWLAPSHQFTNRLFSIQFTPDGRRLFVSLSEGGRVAIWNFRSTNALTTFVPPAPMLANGMHFTPDGRRMVISYWGLQPRVWDTETQGLVSQPRAADTQGWSDCAISGDGRRVADFGQTGRAQICDLETGKPLLEPFAHQGWIRTLRFNTNNTQVLTASQDGTARLWDVRMREPAPVAFPKCEGGAETIFNHAGTRLLISVGVNAVQVCDAHTAQPLSPVLRHPAGGQKARIWTASFSHDDSRILTADNEGLLCLWNATSFQIEHQVEVKRQLMVAKFSPDDRRIVVGDRQGCVTIWSTESGLQVGAIPDCNQEVVSLAFNPRGDSFVAAFANGTARCWTLATGQPASPIFQHQGIVWDAAYSPDGKRVVTASADRTAQVWDVQTGQPLLKRLQHEKEVLSACFSPDGKCILTTSQDGTARVWSALTGVPVSPLLRHTAEVWRGAFSPDSRWVVTGSHDRTARLWDPESGLPLSEPLLHPSAVVRLAVSADGHRLATFGGQSMLWDSNIAPAPVPAWFCDLVEAVGGARLEQNGVLHAVSGDKIFVLRQRFAMGQESDFYGRWAKWFLLDRMQDKPPPCPKP